MINFALVRVWWYIAGALALALVGALAAVAYKDAALARSEGRVAKIQAELTLTIAARDGYRAAAEECDAGVKKLAAESAAKIKTVEDALKRASEKEARTVESDRRLALLTKTPIPPNAKCIDAYNAIRKELRR